MLKNKIDHKPGQQQYHGGTEQYNNDAFHLSTPFCFFSKNRMPFLFPFHPEINKDVQKFVYQNMGAGDKNINPFSFSGVAGEESINGKKFLGAIGLTKDESAVTPSLPVFEDLKKHKKKRYNLTQPF
ncbi:hypothetical protein [Heyndrickxia coagulans]|uniref:hypothetical protein n=1 Tax=Heyndrickxia coagulans TaxID=1398 RepID=UPI002E20393B|nr:hypothetical protein [Heyndrickxia coagulans]MED4963719.1 hypothetical protein [Heyndrickxia coagulans]